jgi:anti-anti-sigma factor
MCADADGPAGPLSILTLHLDHLRAGVPVVHASGCLDHGTAPGLQHVLGGQLAAAPWAIVLDLSALCVLKPDAVPTLVHVAYCAGEADIGLCLVTADHTISGTLATAGVHELFEIHPPPRWHCTP